MAPPSAITLYDVEFTLPEKTLSPFALRIRLLLNYKNIPYETTWISFRDLEATAKAVGAPPTRTNADGNPGYTIPFITVASPNEPTIAISDSEKIARYIEETYPDPDGKILPVETRVLESVFSKYMTENVMGRLFLVLFPPLIRMVPAHVRDWYIESRKSTIGVAVEELPTDEASIAEAWKQFDAAFDELAAHLDKAGHGNYRVTGGISYAEFELISALNIVKRLVYEEGWKRLEGRNGGRWAKLMDLPLYKKLLPANRV